MAATKFLPYPLPIDRGIVSWNCTVCKTDLTGGGGSYIKVVHQAPIYGESYVCLKCAEGLARMRTEILLTE